MTAAPTRVAAAVGGCGLLVALAIANAAGYRYGVADQAFYFPSIFEAVDPSLFPRDTALLQAQGRLMVSDEITGGLIRTGVVSLEALALIAHLGSLALLFASVWVIARRLSASPWTAVACCAAMTLRHRITETGANTFEGYYHPRGLAFSCGVAAAAALATSRLPLAWGLAAAAMILHPTTGLWWLAWLWVATLVVHPRWRRPLLASAAAAAVVAVALLVGTSMAERLRIMDPAWVAPFASKDYVFPTAWPLAPWIANLALPAVVVGVWRWRVRRGVAEPWEAGVVAGSSLLTLIFLASLPLIAARVALAVQMQTSRVFWILDLFATVALVWFLAEAGSATRGAAARPRLVAFVLCAASVGRGLYIMQVEHPERAFVQYRLQDSDWVRTGAWLDAHTPVSTHVLADPDHDWKFGHSVRIIARRDVLVEGVKDAALSLYDRSVALRVQERIEAVGDFGALDAAAARRLAQRYDLDVLVIDRDLPLPELHREGRFRIYRLQ